ncbi:MAG: ABC transporter ATP-binding protein, partial [Candidatus Rokuibacteriota bacterium]
NLVASRDFVLSADRRNVGLVFQSYAIWPHMTVEENVAYPLQVRKRFAAGEIKKRVDAVLEWVSLGGFAERPATQLSGGQQQRVALARALVLSPDILLLDEPLSSLDAKIRVQVRGEIRKLQQEVGITTIYVTHDQEEALSLSDRIAVMRDGRILQVASPKELYERPRSRFVADFVGTNNFIPGICRAQTAAGTAVETAVGPVTARATDGVEVGDRCVVAVRPENVALARADENSFEGRVRLAAYLGSTLRYDVEVAGGMLLKVDVRDPWHADVLPIGQPVAVAFPASAALALADDAR